MYVSPAATTRPNRNDKEVEMGRVDALEESKVIDDTAVGSFVVVFLKRIL